MRGDRARQVCRTREYVACARFSVSGDERKSGRVKTAGLSPAPTRFSRQFVFSILFSDYLGAWLG